MTPQELKNKLLTEPTFVVNFIIDNNEEEVRERLTAIGYTVYSKEEALEAINDIIAKGDMSKFTQALSVPLNLDKIDPIYDQAIEDAATEVLSRFITRTTVIDNDPNSPTFGQDITDTTTQSNFNINNILGIISGGITGYLQSGYNAINPYNTSPYNPNPYNSNTNSRSTTLYWVVGILLLAVIVGAIIYFARKK